MTKFQEMGLTGLQFCNFLALTGSNFVIWALFCKKVGRFLAFCFWRGPIFIENQYLTGFIFQSPAARPRRSSRSVPPGCFICSYFRTNLGYYITILLLLWTLNSLKFSHPRLSVLDCPYCLEIYVVKCTMTGRGKISKCLHDLGYRLQQFHFINKEKNDF